LTYAVVVTAGARADVSHALEWYSERAAEQVDRFVDELERAVERIRAHPQAFPELLRSAGRISLKIFPYQLWYRVQEDRGLIEVLALVHGRQDRRAFAARLD
jgi:plasmid stabilization system protein ParE